MAREFPDLVPEFDLEEAKLVLGYPKTAPLDAELKALLDKVQEDAVNLIKPKGIFEEVEVGVFGEKISFGYQGKAYEIKSKKLASRLAKASSAILFIVTIGPEIEEKVSSHTKEGNYTLALAYDAVGSALAEGLAEAAEKYLQSLFSDSEILPRYSPGYGDLELGVQKILFEILKPESIGVTLTSSFMMKPRKSVSAICGRVLTQKEEALK